MVCAVKVVWWPKNVATLCATCYQLVRCRHLAVPLRRFALQGYMTIGRRYHLSPSCVRAAGAVVVAVVQIVESCCMAGITEAASGPAAALP